MKPNASIILAFGLAGMIGSAALAQEAAAPEQPAQPQNGAPAEFEDSPIEEMGPVLPSSLPRDASLELPEWKLDDVREFEFNNAPVNLGGGLWPGHLWPLMPVPPRLPVMRDGLRPLPMRLPTEGEVLEPIPPALTDIYFGKFPPESVVDPQSLLNEVQQEDLSRFFEEYASRQAGVQVRVLIIGAKQEVPPMEKLQAVADKWFVRQQGLVVVYPMGQPKAAVCYFSQGLQASYTKEQLNAVSDACVKEALVATREEDQLSRYGIKLAVRMNRLREEPKPAAPVVAVAPSTSKEWPSQPYVWGAAVLAGLGTALFLQRKLRKASPASTEPETWHLPDQEMTTRLSAPHSGGTMAILKFR